MQAEALWGADYLYRAMAPEGYFHMVVFSFFSKNPNDRRIVGLLADSKTNNRWQASFRSGGGMAIAALARISRWKKNGTYFTAQNYLDAAKKAYAHLLVNNTAYDDDGKENIIDDYCALMASTELWIATDSALYRDRSPQADAQPGGPHDSSKVISAPTIRTARSGTRRTRGCPSSPWSDTSTRKPTPRRAPSRSARSGRRWTTS